MKNQSLILSSFVLFATLICPMAIAHTEHDKARFVATSGEDKGDCKNRFRPCQTIAFAAQQADKGDTLLVAKGTYYIKKAEDIFHLVSEIVPALGGFEPLDNYQIQNPSVFTTNLVGVPQKYAKTLYERGFNVIADKKGLSKAESTKLQTSLSSAQAMFNSQSESPCLQGMSDLFECENISLLSHIPINVLPTDSSSANDIWGHVDLNTMKEYALIGMRSGVVAVDVSDPINPIIIGSITGQSTTWRDIKVYQFFSDTLNKWQAYAYVSADDVSQGFTIIDLNDLANDISIHRRQIDDLAAHNIYISNVDYGLNIANSHIPAQVHILGAVSAGGSLKSYSLQDPKLLTNTYNLAGASRDDYSHDASSLLINDARAQAHCPNANSSGCLVMLDFNENSLRLWDHTLENQASSLSETPYTNSAYTHSGWWSENKRYVFVHDELDEREFALNTTLRVFDISNLESPSLVSTWTGPTNAIDHNGFVRGNKYYMSNYERGLTVLDVSDPTKIEEIGYFDTFPSSSNTSFNGAWGVYPFLPSGNILVSDIQGGLYILKDETGKPNETKIGFVQSQYQMIEGQTLEIEIMKQGSESASINYEILLGSTESNDLEVELSGTLTWGENEQQNKTISIPAIDDNKLEVDEYFFVKLFNPSQTTHLMQKSLSSVTLKSTQSPVAVISFDRDTFPVKEIDGTLGIKLNRTGDASTATQVEVSIEPLTGSNQDINLLTKTVTWQENDSSSKIIEIEIINDTDSEPSETFNVNLSATSDVLIPQSSGLLTIADDESNEAPTISLFATSNVNVRQTVNFAASVTDPEDGALQYQWQQTSGNAVTLINPNQQFLQFTAPATAETLSFELVVTDDFNQATTASITIEVIAPTPPPTSTNNSSGGGSIWYLLLLMGLFPIRYD
ncbi:choice-of-anchor B family protein, partial [Paraglaciecola sp.]|uniref:choice-of-anchor B family protein n=1 Tax=Paraglaciecola sp. TaxID=1920173 RepID=UPI003EF9BB85